MTANRTACHLPTSPTPTSPTPTSIVEFRQYTLQPGRRDELVDLFDREFVETQETVGMYVLGQFRDADRPDRFVWLRGFADMDARHKGLAAFYGGPVWAEHGAAANATMIDSSDVLLLRPVSGVASSVPPIAARPGTGATPPASVVVALVLSLDRAADAELRSRLTEEVERARQFGVTTVGCYETEFAENTFPALPVRTGEHVLVWLTRYESESSASDAAVRLTGAADAVADGRSASIQRLNLRPTGRSLLC